MSLLLIQDFHLRKCEIRETYFQRIYLHSIFLRKYDVIETSYHFYSDRIDLHFCDDPGGGRSDHPELAGGGAFQVFIFHTLKIKVCSHSETETEN